MDSHLGARPSHAEWQGQVYSLDKDDPKYPYFYDATGYGTGDGLCGWNCRHSFYPYFEGLSERASIPDFTQEENARVYEDTQKQRSYERAIRKSKRELAALDGARSAADDPELKAKLDREFARKSATLKKREERLNEHLKSTGLLPDSSRVRVDGFNRSVSQKAVHAYKKVLDNNEINAIIKDIKGLGIVGEIHIPAQNINTNNLTFDSKHISERNHDVSIDEAKSFIKNAKFSVKRWNGKFENYYSENGAAFVDKTTNEIRTAFSKDEFTESIINALEVLKRNGR